MKDTGEPPYINRNTLNIVQSIRLLNWITEHKEDCIKRPYAETAKMASDLFGFHVSNCNVGGMMKQLGCGRGQNYRKKDPSQTSEKTKENIRTLARLLRAISTRNLTKEEDATLNNLCE